MQSATGVSRPGSGSGSVRRAPRITVRQPSHADVPIRELQGSDEAPLCSDRRIRMRYDTHEIAFTEDANRLALGNKQLRLDVF